MHAGGAETVNAAIYARYSTELQSADSIEDQFRGCTRLAERFSTDRQEAVPWHA